MLRLQLSSHLLELHHVRVTEQRVVHNLSFQVLVDVTTLNEFHGQQLLCLDLMHEPHAAKGTRAQGLQAEGKGAWGMSTPAWELAVCQF